MKQARIVACGACRLCCKREGIFLFPDAGDDVSSYDHEPAVNPLTQSMQMKVRQQANGDCVYLGPKGCSIYARRPVICRAYDCADQYARTPKELRRSLSDSHAGARETFARGREVWIARQKAERGK